jgi:hypothetical protein
MEANMAREELINRLNNLADEETRVELNDLAVNTLREAAREGRIKMAAEEGKACPCPNCGCGANVAKVEDLMTLVREERTRMALHGIPLNGDGLIPYLRCRRVGSRFRLCRDLREMVFITVATREAR